MKNDDVTIVKHGKEYDEEIALYNKYPVAICPECMDSDTYIVTTNNGITYATWHRHTGDCCYKNKGILRIKQVNVNYRCRNCDCAFRKWYDVKEEKTQVSSRYSAIIISGLIFIFSIISVICAKAAEEGVLLSNGGYYTDEFILWNVGSIISAIASFFVVVLLLWLRD